MGIFPLFTWRLLAIIKPSCCDQWFPSLCGNGGHQHSERERERERERMDKIGECWIYKNVTWIPQCQKLLACKSEDCSYSAGEVEVTAPPIVLHELLSYAQYSISVAALAASWGPTKQLLAVTEMTGTWNLRSSTCSKRFMEILLQKRVEFVASVLPLFILTSHFCNSAVIRVMEKCCILFF
jgi:hypothetical protein